MADWEKALLTNLSYLQLYLEWQPILVKMVQEKKQHVRNIDQLVRNNERNPTDDDKVYHLVMFLLKKDLSYFTLFMEALVESDQAKVKTQLLSTINGVTEEMQRELPNLHQLPELSSLVTLSESDAPNADDLLPFTNMMYRNCGNPRGLCLVICYENFDHPKLEQRNGSDADILNLRRVFKWLNYAVEVVKDESKLTISEIIKSFCGKDEMSHYKSLLVFVLSHGDEPNTVYDKQGREANLEQLIEPLKSCDTMRGKPKALIIQACRGGKFEPGEPVVEADSADGKFTDWRKRYKDQIQSLGQRVPKDSDLLVAFSTVPGYGSGRSATTGSVYIQRLCTQIIHLALKEHLADILTMTTDEMTKRWRKVGLKDGSITPYLQQPEFISRLRRKFYLIHGPPKVEPQ